MQIASNLIKVLYLIVLVLLGSCVKEMPQSPSNVNGGEEIISGGGDSSDGTNNEEVKKSYILLTPESILSLAENDPKRIEFHNTNWLNTFTNKIIYKSVGGKRQGFTDEFGNYYDDTDPNNIRSKYMWGTNFVRNGTNYSAACYKDQKNNLSFVGSWKIILIDEAGVEYMYNGNGKDNNSDYPNSGISFPIKYPVGAIEF